MKVLLLDIDGVLNYLGDEDGNGWLMTSVVPGFVSHR